MSTPNVSPTSNPATTNANTTVTNTTSQSWLQKHTVLITIVLSLSLGYFVSDKALSIVSVYENHKVQADTAVLNTQKTAVDADLAQAKAELTDYQAALAQSTQQNAALAAVIANRTQTVVVQQKADAALPPTQLATRWQGLVKDNGVSASANGYTVTPNAAINTVDQLEEVPVLQQNLADETTKTGNLQTDINSANTVISQDKTVVIGLQTELTDQNNVCKSEVGSLQTELKKQKLVGIWAKIKWFGAGFVSGFTTGFVTAVIK